MDDLNKKAVDLLLRGDLCHFGAEPCPYCKGVRIMKDGNALCTSCGREPGNEKITQTPSKAPVLERLEKKLDALTAELENSNSKNRKEILESIDSLASAISKLQK